MNAHTYNAPTISAGTIARTACLLLALTNQVLSALGKPVLPIESQTVEQLVTAGITTVAALSAGQLKVHGSQTRSMCSSWQAIR